MLLTALTLFAAQAPDCRHIGGSLVAARFDRDVLRPGDAPSIDYVYRDGPDGEKVVPRRCITHLTVKGPARLRDATRMQIRPDAKAGDAITLSMRIGGIPQSRTVKVTGADQQVLTGTWHVAESRDCRTRLPSEIRFFDNGRFDFTYPEAMVETMISGGGEFTWDPASGEIVFPPSRRGTARFEGKRLVIVGIEFDFTPPTLPGEPEPPPCRMVLG